MRLLDLAPEEFEAATNEAEEAVQRLMSAFPPDRRTEVMGMMLSSITHAIFEAQSLARRLNIHPKVWEEHFLSLVATALLQFNYDTLFHTGKENVVLATSAGVQRFAEYAGDAVQQMLAKAPAPPATPRPADMN